MLRYLRGQIADEPWDHGLVIECGSIGYELHMAHHQSMQLMEQNMLDTQSNITVPVVMEITQDPSRVHQELVGFADYRSRELYLALRSINGIGRKSALAALESGSWRDALYAVVSDDAKWLCTLEGIGPAKAKLIITKLTGKYGAALPQKLPVPVRQWIAAREDLMSSHNLSLDDAEDLLLAQLKD